MAINNTNNTNNANNANFAQTAQTAHEAHEAEGEPSAASAKALHRIVIVGGGAGGLELATRLGKRLGRRGRAHITLVEKSRSHVWKPKLHEIAAGSMDMDDHDVDYLAQAHWNHFHYRVGEMTGLDRARRDVLIAPFTDDEGRQVTSASRVPYDTLVMALGSQSNDFGTPGVADFALKLESADDARRFQRRLVNAGIRANAQSGPLQPHQMQVAIIGAGATGVELSAELHRTMRQLAAYGLDRIDPERDLGVHLIEASDRVLPALPPRLSASTLRLLQELGVRVHTSAKVEAVLPEGVRLADGRVIAAELVVWAAGVKAADFLKDLDGLESNRINQLVVKASLQTSRDDAVFAIGDCAACAWPQTKGFVPPRAQAAHQQASHLVQALERRINGQPLQDWQYRDFGSLVSLGEFSTVGNMMGGLVGGNLMIEGLFARIMYLSLYKMHELAIHGLPKTALNTLARLISRRTEPHIKLH